MTERCGIILVGMFFIFILTLTLIVQHGELKTIQEMSSAGYEQVYDPVAYRVLWKKAETPVHQITNK